MTELGTVTLVREAYCWVRLAHIPRGRSPGVPKFFGPYLLQNGLTKATKFGTVTHVGYSVFYGSAIPSFQGDGGPSVQKCFWDSLYTYVQTV